MLIEENQAFYLMLLAYCRKSEPRKKMVIGDVRFLTGIGNMANMKNMQYNTHLWAESPKLPRHT